MNGGRPLRILTVCSFNRTRSVMTAAMLDSMLTARVGPGAAVVKSAGCVSEGYPAIPAAVEAMAARGLDVSGHLSRLVTDDLVDGSDLILTAERDHVVRVATMSSAAFKKAMTLPEFVVRSDPGVVDGAADPAGGVRAWVEQLTAGRTPREYLSADIAEIADPTGASNAAFEAAVGAMQELCDVAARRIAAHVPA